MLDIRNLPTHDLKFADGQITGLQLHAATEHGSLETGGKRRKMSSSKGLRALPL